MARTLALDKVLALMARYETRLERDGVLESSSAWRSQDVMEAWASRVKEVELELIEKIAHAMELQLEGAVSCSKDMSLSAKTRRAAVVDHHQVSEILAAIESAWRILKV